VTGFHLNIRGGEASTCPDGARVSGIPAGLFRSPSRELSCRDTMTPEITTAIITAPRAYSRMGRERNKRGWRRPREGAFIPAARSSSLSRIFRMNSNSRAQSEHPEM